MEFSEQVKQHSQQYQELLKNIKNPKNIRILQRDLVYLVGIPQELADEETLIMPEFLGQYGKINKISVGNAYPKKKKQLQKFQSSHVKFENVEEACIAVLCLNGLQIDDYQLKASFGFSRYCHEFLQDKECTDDQCNYIHYWSDPEDCCSSSNKLFNKNLRAFEKEDIVKFLLKRKFDFEKHFESSATNKFTIFPKSEILRQLQQKILNQESDDSNLTSSKLDSSSLNISYSNRSQNDINQPVALAQQLMNPAIRQIQINSADCFKQKNAQKKILVNSKTEQFKNQKIQLDDSTSTQVSSNKLEKKTQKKLKKKNRFREFVKENKKKKNQGMYQKNTKTNYPVPQHFFYQQNPLQQNLNYFCPENRLIWQFCNHYCKCQNNEIFDSLLQKNSCGKQGNTNYFYHTQC